MQLTKEDINNIIAIINRSQIKGMEASTVAILLQKLTKLLDENVQTNPEGDTK